MKEILSSEVQHLKSVCPLSPANLFIFFTLWLRILETFEAHVIVFAFQGHQGNQVCNPGREGRCNNSCQKFGGGSLLYYLCDDALLKQQKSAMICFCCRAMTKQDMPSGRPKELKIDDAHIEQQTAVQARIFVIHLFKQNFCWTTTQTSW